MVYKRYIKRGGKVFGPYYYESYRDKDGKTRTTFVSGPGKYLRKGTVTQEISRKVDVKIWNLLVLFGSIVLVLWALFFASQLDFDGLLTGKITLNIDKKYKPGEIIEGDLTFRSKAGELIPADSRVIIDFDGVEKEFALSELVDIDSVEGNFYVENSAISGEGIGYGIIGEKITYPEVDFKLRVFAKEEEETTEEGSSEEEEEPAPSPPVEEETTEKGDGETGGKIPSEENVEEEEGPEEDSSEEVSEEEPVEEKSVGEKESSKEKKDESDKEKKESSSDSSGSSSEEAGGGEESGDSGEESGAGITGAAVAEPSYTVSGSVKKDEDYELDIEERQAAKIVENSVEIDGEKIDEGEIELDVKDTKITVSTEYSVSEEGFGEEYLGEVELEIEIDLERFELTAEQDALMTARLVYNDKVIVETEEDVNVEGENEEVNETVEPEINDTVPEVNVTTPELNESVSNETLGNGTIINETFGNESLGNVTDKIINGSEYGAILGEPVKWKKVVNVSGPANVTIELPESAGNISVFKVPKVDLSQHPFTLNQTNNTESNKTIPEESETNKSESNGRKSNETLEVFVDITGNVVARSSRADDGEEPRIIRWFRKIGRITGFVIDEGNVTTQEITVEINESEDAIEIEYETPAPVSIEQNTSLGKRVDIIGPDDVHYERVLVFTNISENLSVTNPKSIKIYWSNNNGTEIIPLNVSDLNGNGIMDYVSWVVPNLSNQSFDINITILNVQSYPTVGGNWTVEFITIGQANLSITAYNGTNWSDFNESIEYDLKFLEVKCGDITQNYTWIDRGIANSSVFIQDYQCDNETSFETSKVLTPGKHTIEFDFGGVKAYAHNLASATSVKAESGVIVMTNDQHHKDLDYGYDITKAFIIRRYAMYDNDANQEPDGGTADLTWSACRGTICGNITATRTAADGENLVVSYSILQADNIQVWNFSLNWVSDGTLERLDWEPVPSLPNNFDDKCFVNVFRATSLTSSDITDFSDNEVRSNITSATNITFVRDGEDGGVTADGLSHGEVVCFLDGSHVERVNVNMSEGEPTTDNIPLGYAFNLSRSWALHDHRQPDSGVGQNSIWNNLTGSKTLQLHYNETGQTAAGDQPQLTAYVIEHEENSGTKVHNLKIVPGTSDQNITTDWSGVENVSTSLLSCYNSMDAGGGTAHTRGMWAHYMVDNDTISSTNYRTRGSTQHTQIICSIIEWGNGSSYGPTHPHAILNSPANNTNFTVQEDVILNTTIFDETDEADVRIFAGNESSNDDTVTFHRYGLVYQRFNQSNNSEHTYNFSAPPTFPDGDIVHLWKFNNDSKFNESESSIYNYIDGERNITKFFSSELNITGGKFGGGITFDGASYVNLSSDGAMVSNEENYTISMWIQTTDTGGNNIFYGEGNSTSTTEYAVFFTSGTNLAYYVVSGASVMTMITAAPIFDGNWHHVAAVKNGPGDWAMYGDGYLLTTAAGTPGAPEIELTNLGSGFAAGLELPFVGTVDEVTLWNRSLSQTEIEYLAGRSPSQTYIWKVNVTDSSGNSIETNFSQFTTTNQGPWIILDQPANGTNYTYVDVFNLTLNASVYDDTPADAMDILFFGANDTVADADWHKHGLIGQIMAADNGTRIENNFSNPTVFPDADTVLLFHLDNRSIFDENHTYVYDFAFGLNNGTTITAEPNMTKGKFGGGFVFNELADRIDANSDASIDFVSSENYTWSAWINRENSGKMDPIYSKLTVALASNGFTIAIGVDNKLIMQDIANKINMTGNTEVLENNWTHVSVTFSNGTTNLYVNGVHDGNGTSNFSSNTAQDLNIGYDGTKTFNGTLDELAIWNKTLSHKEVYDLYRLEGRYRWKINATDTQGFSNESITRDFSVFNYFPTITQNSPSNLSHWISFVSFNVSIDQDGSCVFSIDGSPNNSMTSINSTWFSFDNTTITDGLHNVSYACNDTSNQFSFTNATRFLVDTVNPDINFTDPTPVNSSSQTADAIFVNISSNDSNAHYAFLDFELDVRLHLTMDQLNDSGDPVDSSSYSNNGSFNGDAEQTDSGVYGKSSGFDGSGDYIKIKDSNSLDFDVDENFTVAAWVTTTTNNERRIVSKQDPTGLAITKAGYTLETANGGFLSIITNLTNNVTVGPTSTMINDSQPHHLVAVFERTGNLTTYIDGVKDNSSSIANINNNLANTESFDVGHERAASTYLRGEVDEIIVFSRALSATEISALYNATGTQYEQNFTGLSPATYSFTGHSVDEVGNKNETELKEVIIIPIAAPNITLNAPANASDHAMGAQNITLNLTALGDSPMDIFIFGANSTRSDADMNKHGLLYRTQNTTNNTATLYNWTGPVLFPTSDMVMLFHFDNRTEFGENNSHVVDFTDGVFNGTMVGSAELNITDGKFGGGLKLNGRDDNLVNISYNSTFDLLKDGNDLSLFIWAYMEENASTYGGNQIFFAQGNGGGTGRAWMYLISTDLLRVNIGGASADLTATGFNAQDKWHHFGFVYNGSAITGYIDGVEQLTVAQATIDEGADASYVIGSGKNGAGVINGTLDELVIFNRSLSQAEVRDLYRLNKDTYHWKGNATDTGGLANESEIWEFNILDNPPVITVINPITNNSKLGFSVEYNVSLNEEGSWCGYSLDHADNVTMTKYNNTWFNFTDSTVGEGYHNITYSCNDTSNQYANTDLFFFFTDSYIPDVNFTLPTRTNASNQLEGAIFANLTSNDSNYHYSFVDFNSDVLLWLRMDDINGSKDPVDSSTFSQSSSRVADAVQTGDGHFGKGFALDGTGDYVKVENEASFDYDFGGNYTFSQWVKVAEIGNENWFLTKSRHGTGDPGGWVTGVKDDNQFFFGAAEEFAPGWGTSVDSSTTLTANTWYHLLVTHNGRGNITLYINGVQDTSGSLTMAPDTTSDVKIGLSPVAATYGNGTVDDIIIFNRTLNGIEIGALYNSSVTQQQNNYTGLVEGEYKIDGWAIDKGGNVNYTQRQINVDLTGPGITIKSPINASKYDISPIEFNVSLSENSSWCGYSLDHLTNITLFRYNDTYFNFSNSTIPEGQHNVTFACNDTLGNFNVSAMNFFFVDDIDPDINFTDDTPPNASTSNETWAIINVSSNDTNDHYVFVDFDTDVALWMRMDDIQSDGDPIDLSSFSNNGSISGQASQTPYQGYYGDAFTFDGSGDRVRISGMEGDRLAANFTIAFWFKTAVATDPLFTDYYANINLLPSAQYGWAVVTSGGKIRYTAAGGTAGEDHITGSTDVDDDEWHHVAIVDRGRTSTTNENTTIYLDGVLEVDDERGAISSNANRRVYIGSQYLDSLDGDVSTYLAGDIDEAFFFQRALNETEVASLYNASANQYIHNFTGISDGTKIYQAFSADYAGNKNQTEIRELTIDTFGPTMSLNAPGNNSNFKVDIFNITLNVSVHDPHDVDTLYIYGVNSTSAGSFYRHGLLYQTFNLSDGDEIEYNWTGPVITPDEYTQFIYHFDNNSLFGESETLVYDFENGIFNGSVHGDAHPNMTDGKFAGTFAFDGSGDYINTSLTDYKPQSDNITFVAWVNTTNAAGAILSKCPSACDDGGSISFTLTSGKPILQFEDQGPVTATHTVNDGEWHMVGFTVNAESENVTIYVDGGVSASGTVDPDSSTNLTNAFLIGWSSGGFGEFDGFIDEAAMWNRTLSSVEMKDLYRLKADVFIWKANSSDSYGNFNESEILQFNLIDPNALITIASPPANISNYNTTDIDFNVTLDKEGSWCGFSLDGADNITMTKYNATLFNYTNVSTLIGGHDIIFSCNTTLNNYTTTNPQGFFIDIIHANINFTDPTTLNGTVMTDTAIFINLSSNDTNSHYSFADFNASLKLWLRMEGLNESGDPLDSSKYLTNASAQDGAAQTYAGYFGRGYNLDGVDDFIKILPGGYNTDLDFASEGNFTLSTWIKSQEPDDTFIISKFDTSFLGENGYALELVSGKAYAYIDGNASSSGIIGTSDINDSKWHHIAAVFKRNENVTLYVDGSIQNSTSITSVGNVTTDTDFLIGKKLGAGFLNATLDEVMVFDRALSEIEVGAIFNSTVNHYQNNYTGLNGGTYLFTGYSVDKGGSLNQTAERTVKIDLAGPVITIQTPENNTNYSTSTLSFNASLSEQGSWCGFSLNATANVSMTKYNNTWFNYSEENLNGVNYNITVSCNDTLNNFAVSEMHFFSIDVGAPTISNAQINATSTVPRNTTVKVNATISDSSGLGTVILQIDPPASNPYNVTPTSSGDEYYNDTIVLNETGQWVFTFWANDTVGNNASVLAQDLASNEYIEVEAEEIGIETWFPTDGQVNATKSAFSNITINVSCARGVCGGINISLNFDENQSVGYALMSTSNTAVPFWTNITLNPLNITLGYRQSQIVTFYFNATGTVHSNHTFDLNANLTSNLSISNDTAKWNVTIKSDFTAISITLSDKLASQINWTVSSTPLFNLSADGNNDAGNNLTDYFVNISTDGGQADLYVRGNSDLFTADLDVLGLGNETVNYNVTNRTVPGNRKANLTTNFSDNPIGTNLNDGASIFLKFFLNVPEGTPAGTYNNTLEFKAVGPGQSP